jgi:hypothetical protein
MASTLATSPGARTRDHPHHERAWTCCRPGEFVQFDVRLSDVSSMLYEPGETSPFG